MIRKIAAAIGLVAVLLMAVALPAQASQPLRGDMFLQFNLAVTGPSEVVPDYVGTISIEGQEFGMAFFNTGTGKPFVEQPSENAFFYEETWVIYESLTFSFAPDGTLATFEPGPVVMSGYDRGIYSAANNKYRMNGQVEVAVGPFAPWLGGNVHMSGEIEPYDFGAPHFAPGTLRVN